MIKDCLPYAFGLVLLGTVGFAFGDFALQWQPVPSSVAHREMFSLTSAGILSAAGLGMLLKKFTAASGFAIGSFFALWVLALHLPRVIAAPRDVSLWLGIAEITAIAFGGFATALVHSKRPVSSVKSKNVAQYVRWVFAACLAIFGLSHFVYAQFTAAMIPEWIPARLFFAYLTGTAHVAASLSFLTGIMTQLAAGLLALMFAIFVVVLHLPRVVADAANHAEWTMLAIATLLTGAAWMMRVLVRHAAKRFDLD